MKLKILLAFSLAAVVLAGCEKDAVTVDRPPQHLTESNLLSYDEAMTIAENAASLLGDDDATRTSARTIDRSKVGAVLTSGTRSVEQGTDTLIYVFNYADDAGFALVAKDKRAASLLAVTERGSFDGITTDNAGFQQYIGHLRGYLESAASAPAAFSTGIGDAVITEWKDETTWDTTAVGPYLSVAWGQETPFNYFCFVGGSGEGTRTVAGCDAIAIAQLMSYYEYPKSTQLTYSFAPVSTLTLDWDQWKESKYLDPYGIAMFVREIGQRNNTVYKDGSAVSNFKNDISCLQSFGYTTGGTQNYGKGTVISSLNNRQLVMMCGTNANNKGHAWVIDGYSIVDEIYKHYQRPRGRFVWTLVDSVYNRRTYLHFNWGHDGGYNGLYFVEKYSSGGVGEPYTYTADVFTPPTDNADYDYNNNVKIIPYINH